ncbi:MAG: SusD/RagB family nutrient-binding outer membrane lipoprotein [Ferruginibacter sp.]|nr:SusD/RagB family nutrient-binding outer membrane lipoprotein [Cytophagales bacterium]
MKKTALYILGLLTTLGGTGCDDGFDELNINQTAPIALNPSYLMNNAIIRASFPGQTLVYEAAIVQQIVSPNGGVLAGGNFNQDNKFVNAGLWQRYYREVLKSAVDVLDKTRTDAGRTNLYHMARIWRAYAAMVLTDTYGDVPYTEAGLGYLQLNIVPKYDAQQAIYTDILKELDEASAALDATKTRETGDVLYSGDIVKWRRLGYSLLLRAAMRHSKADPAVAQSYVTKAVAGGLMQSNADNGVVRHTTLYTNELGATLNGSEANNYYLTGNFVSYLRANRDPRLTAIAVRYVGAKSGAEQVAARISRDTTVQIGMPLGYDNGTIVPVAASGGLASFYDYSQLDRTRLGKIDAPAFLITHAQTQLLLAEAVVRGWAPGNAADLYAAGVRAHMQQMGSYDANASIGDAAIAAYLLANPLAASRELEQINTQYWVASFLNGPETFANFRRSGFPALTPNPYPGRAISGAFIRRLSYPDSELSVNLGNVQQAIGRQGPDNLDTRVWWDK